MDLTTAAIILAREAGYTKTRIACKRLKVTPGQLLALRRQLLELALGVDRLPPLNPVQEKKAC